MAEIKCAYTELKPIHKLIEHPKNPHKHSKEQIERLANIIDYQGVRHPIIVSKRSGFIVAGHGRLAALKKLQIAEVPIDYQEFKDEASEYAFIVSDNAIGKDEWAALDIEQIKKDIEIMPINVQMLGLKDFEIKSINENANEDEAPEPPKTPRSKLGDLIELGEHRLLCGDSTDIKQVERLMNGENADMVFTDPPYGMSVVKADGNIGGNRVGKNGYGKKGQYDKKAKCGVYRPIIGDDKPFDPTFLLDLAETQIIWGANHFSDKLPTSPHWIVWHKEMPEGTDFSGAELAWTNINKKAVKVYKFTWAGMTRQGERIEELSERVHPTQKPVGLFSNILNDYDPSSVIDLFGGSGSTLIACEKTKRKCYIMELDPHYVDVIISRWCNYTGKDQIKINGKETEWSVDV